MYLGAYQEREVGAESLTSAELDAVPTRQIRCHHPVDVTMPPVTPKTEAPAGPPP